MGLLLLRVSVGIIAAMQGTLYLQGANGMSPARVTIGLIAIASGVMLLVGFLTPFSGGVIGLGIIGIGFSWLPSAGSNLLDGLVSSVLGGAVSAAIALLGPGAYSVDARLFGRRQIIIPPASRARL